MNIEQELSLLIVFAAGLLSFRSPCVLPLIPGYIAFVARDFGVIQFNFLKNIGVR
ncbi:MAG: hypothetical protein H8D96_06185 [Desulfobacterales bacterium]|uniref:Cytochrome c biogenesis protein CcdA n=1 Tax=Candidatus Desulfatibia vada TaxID=2841696 RepID=A0A8J6NQ78_9BACT|nr:hypothetical protein [Candidatus Desulfatibia vada]